MPFFVMGGKKKSINGQIEDFTLAYSDILEKKHRY